ncbi:MAG TPA: pentapeptide repeat-containing protein [Candidatus Acidoferrum sp.]|nr:pentapeptide repeat-containing protein [Candidatus Acidoferrum sp.]
MPAIPLRNNTYVLEVFDSNLSGSTFEDCLLANANLKYTSFEKARIQMVRFDSVQFTSVSFEKASIERGNFVNCSVKNGRYTGMTIEGIQVTELLEMYFATHPEKREAMREEARISGALEDARAAGPGG